ncbi:MAG TPA: FimV/HubP family polar landmark protein, partial [Steroidobacteraceae bacterium]|nr:FimV/HubP family polar landmark protein [Steroidobacteraceae bacterium]
MLSPLNAPLDAEIELVDVAPDEANSVQVQLASRDTFDHYGLERPAYLSNITMKTVRTQDGREVIKLKSTDPITEPFVTLLVEVNWSRGRLVREYTMLLDPPVYTPNESQVASAPVAAPSTDTGTREGAIARTQPAAAPAPAPAPAETPAPASTPAPAAAAPAPETHHRTRSARAATPAPAAPGSGEGSGAGTSHTVHRGETLSEIASGVAGASVSAASTRSWMLAIYQANPQAFRQNMNILRSGSVLSIPDAAAAAAVSPAEAAAEIRRQYAAWRSGTPGQAPATASTEKPGRLKLVTPSENTPAAANATPKATAPTAAADKGAAASAAQQAAQQAAESESKRLLELKNQELARMQAQAAAKQGTAPVTQPAAPPAAPPPQAAAPPPAAATPPAAAPPAAENTTPPAPPAETAPPPPPL